MKKLSIISLVLVVAIGLMGVGYALWSDVLYLDTTVHTGSIGLEWSQGVPYDNEAPEKDVSYATCSIVGNTLTITVTNAYPCITYTIPIDLHVTGTVPVHTRWDYVGGNMDLSWITMPNWGGMQLHPGDDPLIGDVVIHLDNTAVQSTTYTADYELTYWQYNEVGP